jgi:pyruvate carboxylase
MDTPINPLDVDWEAEKRNMLIEEGQIIDITPTAKKVGIKCKAAVTDSLFEQLFPYAEDATKGVTFESIMEDVLRLFKKEVGNRHGGYAEFGVIAKTYVKRILSKDQVETFPDGKPRDKRLTVWVGWMPDEKKNSSLVFGVKDSIFLA